MVMVIIGLNSTLEPSGGFNYLTLSLCSGVGNMQGSYLFEKSIDQMKVF